MKILVINAGSSSLKYQLIEMPSENVVCTGLVERIGLEKGNITHKTSKDKIELKLAIPNHKTGLEKVTELLLDSKTGVIKDANEIDIVSHRVVHGGSSFASTTIITQEVKDKIKELFSLAPLHNPANLEGIEVTEAIFANAKQVAVFDTAFHQSLPERAYRYAIPAKFLEEDKIRAYGFHGTSHKYVSKEAIKLLNKENTKIISIHLGNGCSISAIENGKSIDTSLGFGPMNGLVMGTRSGDIDQSVITYLMTNKGYTISEINNILQKQSGMLGLTGYSDLRDIEEQAEKGNKACVLALEISTYRIKKFIGAYAAIMNGIDAIIFTAGIGENSDVIRSLVCKNMKYLGIELNEEKNSIRSKEAREIQSDNSKVNIYIIPTNEEIEIAKQSYRLLS
ncbi:MAG: acetate kinase [Flavobacteriaceae bacterium]|nr:acetate kinase [Flavobacteriaceae bacterium]